MTNPKIQIIRKKVDCCPRLGQHEVNCIHSKHMIHQDKKQECPHNYLIVATIDKFGNSRCAKCNKWIERFPPQSDKKQEDWEIEFDKKINSDNYKKDEYYYLVKAEDSLLYEEPFPESQYELDEDKVKSFIRKTRQEAVEEERKRTINNVCEMAVKEIREYKEKYPDANYYDFVGLIKGIKIRELSI
jgi:hypothetical protein